jgi:hypothetical protein
VRSSIICEAAFGVRELASRGTGRFLVGFRADDAATALRVLAAFAATRLAAAFLATFADFLDVLPAMVFTPALGVTCSDLSCPP